MDIISFDNSQVATDHIDIFLILIDVLISNVCIKNYIRYWSLLCTTVGIN